MPIADASCAPSTRFVRGNRGGPGDPFGPRVALLRQAFLDAITPKDVQSVAHALILKASTGELTAAKLILQYALGKPVAFTDFGTDDSADCRQRKTAAAPFVEAPLPTIAPASLVSVLDTLPTCPLPAASENRMNKAERKAMYREMRRQRRENAPSSNGSNGAAAKTASAGVSVGSKTTPITARAS
jgi:hypothetical protein